LNQDQIAYIRNDMYDVTKSGGTAGGAFIGFPFGKVAVGGKTGSAELGLNRSYTSAWFASFAGLAGQKPRFVTVIMVDKGGIGGTVAAPAVRQVWDTVFGVENHKAAFPSGRPPAGLPSVGAPTARGAGPAVTAPATPGSTAPAGIAALAVPPVLAVRFASWERRR
jgi:penicillin-binding protein 2